MLAPGRVRLTESDKRTEKRFTNHTTAAVVAPTAADHQLAILENVPV
jgi:hypothetical protein